MESVQLFNFLSGFVQNTFINSVRDTVVDQFCQYQAIFAFVEHLEGIGWERQKVTNVRIAGEDGVDMPREFGSFIFVDSMGDVGGGTLDLNLSSKAALRNMAGRARSATGGGRCRSGSTRGLALRWSRANFGNKLS